MAEGLSQLQGLMYLSDIQRRRFVLEQLELKEQLEMQLEQPTTPIQEMELRDGLRMVAHNLQRIKTEGLL